MVFNQSRRGVLILVEAGDNGKPFYIPSSRASKLFVLDTPSLIRPSLWLAIVRFVMGNEAKND